jgi:putative iron-only hydrogenase system regulator
VFVKNRIGTIAIVIEDRSKVADQVNQILSKHGEIILGRMGVPSRELDLSVISLIVEGTSDDIGAMTGQLGNLSGVMVKSALTGRATT